MDDFLFAVIQILKPAQNLTDDQLCLLLVDLTILLQVKVQVGSRAQFQNGTKTVVVDFHGVILLHHSAMIQILVNLVFANGMLYVVVLDLFAPRVVEMMNFASYFPTVFEVVSLINFGIPAFSEDAQNKVPVFEHCELRLGLYPAVLGALLIAHSLEFIHILNLFLVKKLKFFSETPLLVLEHFEFELVDFFHFVLVDVVEL